MLIEPDQISFDFVGFGGDSAELGVSGEAWGSSTSSFSASILGVSLDGDVEGEFGIGVGSV